VVHRSREQQHYFNAPFQLALPLGASSSRFLSDRYTVANQFFLSIDHKINRFSSPESAETSSLEVLEGDLIVVATDGLFDNMPTQLIESELAALVQYTPQTLQATCNSLALQARQLAMDSNHMSPFAQKAVQHGIPDAMGMVFWVYCSYICYRKYIGEKLVFKGNYCV